MNPKTWKPYAHIATLAIAIYVGSYVFLAFHYSYREEVVIVPGGLRDDHLPGVRGHRC